jgi:Sec7-like guanine-nucleotide exchange factor
MLLNTDLHLVQISSHAKMSCALFCENTMSTICEQKISLDDNEEVEEWKEQLESNLKVNIRNEICLWTFELTRVMILLGIVYIGEK